MRPPNENVSQLSRVNTQRKTHSSVLNQGLHCIQLSGKMSDTVTHTHKKKRPHTH